MFTQNSSAERYIFESETSKQKLTIHNGTIKSIDFTLEDDKELEIVFTLNVKDNYPIDMWFVNGDNYILLSNGAQFLFFIDGSGQQLAYARRVVTLTEPDNYKLVMSNLYAGKTVEVEVDYEIRTYLSESNENSYSPIVIYSLAAVIIALSVILIILFLKIRKSKKNSFNSSIKTTRKIGPAKSKKDNSKKSQTKTKRNKNQKETRKKSSKVQKKETTVNKTPHGIETTEFCGNCGIKADSKFCKSCGEKI